MAADYFLQIAGIEGDSQDAKHKGWLDVLSWSWGESHPESPSPGGGGGGAGKVNMQDLSFMTTTSKASPKLFLACAAGQHFKEAKLVGRKSGGKDQQEFLTWTFSDVLVSSFQVSASSEVPVESVSLNYAKVKLEYRPQKADGSLDAPITAGWDLKANKKL